MNERIKELAEQADLLWSERDGYWKAYDDSNDLERFAELVRQDEREACAKVCESIDAEYEAGSAYACAEEIRARGNT
jgi:hypothetical protein